MTAILLDLLWLGDIEDAIDIPKVDKSYDAVVTVMERPVCSSYNPKIERYYYPMKDDPFWDAVPILRQTTPLLMRLIETEHKRVLVHCFGAEIRSPTVVVAYLTRSWGLPLPQAIGYVGSRKSGIRVMEDSLVRFVQEDNKKVN